jgi:SAM-dependent methyltransferase
VGQIIETSGVAMLVVHLVAMQIEEAKRRYEQILEKSSKDSRFAAAKEMNVDFLHTTDIGNTVWEAGEPYDAVTCMFALHYFFHSEETARKVIEMAARNLKPGGHFFGVLPNGKEILRVLGATMKPQKSKYFTLIPRWLGKPRPFGSPYNFAISDTVTQVRHNERADVSSSAVPGTDAGNNPLATIVLRSSSLHSPADAPVHAQTHQTALLATGLSFQSEVASHEPSQNQAQILQHDLCEACSCYRSGASCELWAEFL